MDPASLVHAGYFNPRTHKECDITRYKCRTNKLNFNPRTHKECDTLGQYYLAAEQLFQSTHSQGVRWKIRVDSINHQRFQSTHSQGVRYIPCLSMFSLRFISIHALTRSAMGSKLIKGLRNVFQSTHSQGVR